MRALKEAKIFHSSVPTDIRDKILLEDYIYRRKAFIRKWVQDEKELKEEKGGPVKLQRRFKVLVTQTKMQKLIELAEENAKERWIQSEQLRKEAETQRYNDKRRGSEQFT